MLLIIDNQSSYIKKFKRNFLAEQNFEYHFIDHNEPLVIPDGMKVSGIILSGGKGNPYEPLNLTANFVAMMNFDVPILGFCLGHEIIAVAGRGRIRKLPLYQNKKELVTISKPDDPIFAGIDKTEVLLQEKHSFEVFKLPNNFEILGHSAVCKIEIMRHKEKPIYGFQSHPEVSKPEGIKMVANFLEMCGLEVIL
jgi:GMP synthase-like glutamine amidotransferase